MHVLLISYSCCVLQRDADGSHHAGPVMLPLQKQDPEDPLLHPRCVAEINYSPWMLLANNINVIKEFIS
jgi:hypothetical protein